MEHSDTVFKTSLYFSFRLIEVNLRVKRKSLDNVSDSRPENILSFINHK